jgi:beta-lactamase superfamily II metal-dependent hydrolase
MAPNNQQPEMKAPKSGVTVRMYNMGFGDCFLLAFPGSDDKPRFMLIDCGVHHSYPEKEERARLVAEDIAKATGNHLHVVAVTHEHTDHLYGFKFGREIFEQIAIDQLWLPWTENPDDPMAKELKERYGIQVRALEAAIALLENQSHKAQLAESLQNVLNFEFPNALSAAAGANKAQLEFLREKSQNEFHSDQDYRTPGEAPKSIQGVEGARVFVLGPPRSVKWIRSVFRKKEVYSDEHALTADLSFASALLSANRSATSGDKEIFERSLPFGGSLEEIKSDSVSYKLLLRSFEQKYGMIDSEDEHLEWRKIDVDWLYAAESLSLAINGKTNNSSLVLAVELTGTDPKKILLFVGDAQVGNWLSWHELSWPGDEDADSQITVEDMLNRTVLYKVGHHGSHNATLKDKGLEMMTSPELVALIPVDSAWADEKMGWEHPAHSLLKRLQTKSKGRIIRTDNIPGEDAPLEKPDNISKKDWKAFTKELDWDKGPEKLWIEFTVKG